MTAKEMRQLGQGDVIRSLTNNGRAAYYIVTGNYGSHVTAVSTVDVTNEVEWELVLKARHEHPSESER